MRRLNRLAPDRHRTGQECNHGTIENIIAVSRHHVSGTCDIDVIAVRTQPQEILRGPCGSPHESPAILTPPAPSQKCIGSGVPGSLVPALIAESLS